MALEGGCTSKYYRITGGGGGSEKGHKRTILFMNSPLHRAIVMK